MFCEMHKEKNMVIKYAFIPVTDAFQTIFCALVLQHDPAMQLPLKLIVNT